MRRTLVLTDETARHPYRASLPPYVRQVNSEKPQNSLWWIQKREIRDYFYAYIGGLIAVSLFIW